MICKKPPEADTTASGGLYIPWVSCVFIQLSGMKKPRCQNQTAGNFMVDDNGLEPLTLRTSSYGVMAGL